MKSYHVCVYAIAKNEKQFVDRWMDSMKEADQIIVTDTGSTDGTVERLRELGAIVYEETIQPWRFDHARNRSLEHVPENTDICVCTDLDEVFSPGWRDALEQAWHSGATRARYLYNWSHHPDGSPDLQLYYTKVHARNSYKWSYPVHEYLIYEGTTPEQTVLVENMVLDHYPDTKKSRSSYLPLLEMAVKENPIDSRMLYYLGREYLYSKHWQKCIDTMHRRLNLPFASWEEERSASMRWMAYSYSMLGKPSEAYRWYFRAIAETPFMRDPYVEFAQFAYKEQNWPLVFFLTQQALQIREKSKTFANMGYAWDHTPEDLCAIACWNLQMFPRAEQHAKNALRITPDNERLKNNLRMIQLSLEHLSTNPQHSDPQKSDGAPSS
ncbi:tetratricopeptide repeat-containing glycosyltransferase [Clostridium minihomine]|uniref:tetratricopeptide repeat-containing glycosyltransferase n=1 Tax=Clostridium minihomine TaxID=2045012 RepID=UPI000C760AAE|nr:glycosyltransferase [Clostridium minihomine]